MTDPGTAVPADGHVNGGMCYECGYSLAEIVRANPVGWFFMFVLICTICITFVHNFTSIMSWLEGEG